MVKIAPKYLYTLCLGEKELSEEYRQDMTRAQAIERNAHMARQGLTTRWKICWWAR